MVVGKKTCNDGSECFRFYDFVLVQYIMHARNDVNRKPQTTLMYFAIICKSFYQMVAVEDLWQSSATYLRFFAVAEGIRTTPYNEGYEVMYVQCLILSNEESHNSYMLQHSPLLYIQRPTVCSAKLYSKKSNQQRMSTTTKS